MSRYRYKKIEKNARQFHEQFRANSTPLIAGKYPDSDLEEAAEEPVDKTGVPIPVDSFIRWRERLGHNNQGKRLK
jgi:hypothetical protein